MRRLLPLLFMVALAAAPDRPPLVPTRDAAVTYRILTDGPPRELHVHEQSATGMVRFEVQGQGGFALMNLRTGQVVLVVPQQHAYLDMPPGAASGPRQFLLDPGMKFTRTGNATIAGNDCTLWKVDGPEGPGTVCVTAEGVILRASGTSGQAGAHGGLEAISVSYLPQPAELFTYPADYHQMDVAKVLQGLQAKPPAP
jgi:hypothetical protein